MLTRAGVVAALVIGTAACDSVLVPPVPGPGAARETAVAIGEPVTTVLRDQVVWGNGRIRLTVTDILRGAAALDRVVDWNRFNDIPPPGTEYLLATVTVEVQDNASPTIPIELNPTRFAAVRSNGAVYPDAFLGVAGASPPTTVELFAGWATMLVAVWVDVTDDGPLLVFDRGDSHARWLRLH